MATTTEMTQEELKKLQEDIALIVGSINDPATAEAVRQMMSSLTALTDKITDAHTTPQTLLDKLKSRKFLMALLGAIAGVCGMLNSGGNIVAILIFVILEVLSIFGYFFTEGTIDNTRTKELIQMATQIATIVGTLTPTMMDSSAIEVEAIPSDADDEPAVETVGYIQEIPEKPAE